MGESHWEPAACLDKDDQSPKRTNAVQVPPPRGGARRGSYISQGIFELTQRQGLMTPFLAPFHLLLFPSGLCVFLREPNLQCPSGGPPPLVAAVAPLFPT